MINNFIILFHFFNLTFGLVVLLIFSRRIGQVPSPIQKSFFQQALFYNLAILSTVILDFLYFFFWTDVSGSAFAIDFLAIISVSNLTIAILWCLSFVVMIHEFLEIRCELKKKIWFKIGAVIVVFLLCFSLISSIFKIIPVFFGTFSLICGYFIFLISLGYSIHIYTKAAFIINVDRRKSLRIYGMLFIIFSALSLFAYIDVYPLHLIPREMRKFSLNVLDLLFNLFTVIWGLMYLSFLNNGTKVIELSSVSEQHLISKFQISKRELEVIHLICSGKQNQEIADSLFISVGTVKDHLYKIYKKTGVKNRTQLAKLF